MGVIDTLLMALFFIPLGHQQGYVVLNGYVSTISYKRAADSESGPAVYYYILKILTHEAKYFSRYFVAIGIDCTNVIFMFFFC